MLPCARRPDTGRGSEGRASPVAPGATPGTTAVLFTPIDDPDPGPMLVTADVFVDGSIVPDIKEPTYPVEL